MMRALPAGCRRKEQSRRLRRLPSKRESHEIYNQT